MDKELLASIDVSGIRSLRSVVEYIDFLEDERRRAYKDIERLEVENDKLRVITEQLLLGVDRLQGEATTKKARPYSASVRRKYGRR